MCLLIFLSQTNQRSIRRTIIIHLNVYKIICFINDVMVSTHLTLSSCWFVHSIHAVAFREEVLHSLQMRSNLQHPPPVSNSAPLPGQVWFEKELLHPPCGRVVALSGGGAAPAADEDLRGQGAEQQAELQHGGGAEPGHGRARHLRTDRCMLGGALSKF